MIDYNALREQLMKADENVSEQANKVHLQLDEIQKLIKEAFVPPPVYDSTFYGDSASAKCLPIILSALGWNGELRHVIEALPHGEHIEDMVGLKVVLNRLNYSVDHAEMPSIVHIRDELPCITVISEDVGVVLDLSVEGEALVYYGRTDSYIYVQFEQIKNNIYFIRHTKAQSQAKNARYNWVSLTFSAFKKSISSIFVMTLVINVLALVMSIYVTKVYDYAIGGKSHVTLFALLAGIGCVIIAEMKLRNIRSRMIAYLGARYDALIQINAFRNILNLPLTFTETAPLSSQLARFRQFEVGKSIFISPVANAILDLPFTVAFVAAIFIYGGYLGWVTIALACIFVVMGFVVFPIMGRASMRAGDAKTKLDGLVMESAAKVNSIRENNIEQLWIERTKESMSRYLMYRFRSQFLNSISQTVAQNLVMATAVLTMCLGALMVMNRDLTVGGLVGVSILMWRVFMPIQILFLSAQSIKQLIGTLSQINQLFRLKLEREPGQVPTFFRKYEGAIHINAVSFKYATATDLSIKGASINVKPGEMVAIIGPNGSGKTTLLKLIMGLYQPISGAIRLDGLDLRQLDVGEVRQTIAYSSQNLEFYYGTVIQNIALADPTASHAKILKAIEEAKFEMPTDRFAEGFDTRLNFANRNILPEGMLQRLNLARAWVKDAPLYVLDEPGTRLDAVGDMAFVEKLKSLKGKSTVIFSTARPSHMMLADRVICIVKGQIVAEGKPEEIVPKYMEAMLKAAA